MALDYQPILVDPSDCDGRGIEGNRQYRCSYYLPPVLKYFRPACTAALSCDYSFHTAQRPAFTGVVARPD